MYVLRPLLALLALPLVACDSQDLQRSFEEAAGLPPEGFTAVQTCGAEPETADADDWRTSPLYQGVVRVEPACPNPVRAVDNVILQFTITQTGAIQGGVFVLRAFDASGRLVRLEDPVDASLPGLLSFSVPAGLLPRQGLQRLYVFDGVGGLVTYGDVFIQ